DERHLALERRVSGTGLVTGRAVADALLGCRVQVFRGQERSRHCLGGTGLRHREAQGRGRHGVWHVRDPWSQPKERRSPAITWRIRNVMAASSTITMAAATTGWLVANHVMKIANASSAVLSAKFESGSGDGVTATRAALFALCAASAM